MYLVNRMSSLSQKVHKYFALFIIAMLYSVFWWCVWVGCDISCSCEDQGRAKGGSGYSCEANCFVLWEFLLKLLHSKEELDWFRVFECWLLDFADIVLRTVFWVSTIFMIISSFVQRFFFRREIFSSKDFSSWLGRLLLTSLFKYSEKESIFLFKRANP